MARLTKRVVDATETRGVDYFIWDDELPGFGLRIFRSGKRSYLVQYRAAGRTRRYTIGIHGVWTPETARREARMLLGRIAQGENPSEERRLDHQAITVKELCERYLEDADNGLILGKARRPKKISTLTIDKSRIRRHIVPLLGTRRVKDIASTDVNRFVRDVTAGRTKANVKTKARGRAIVRGGAGTAARALGLLGGIFTYAIEQGIIEKNPAHGVKKQADRIKDRHLTEQEYRELGVILQRARKNVALGTSVAVIRFLALTGCRRGEVLSLKWAEVDEENSCLRFEDSKEGTSVRPVGLSVLDLTDGLRTDEPGTFVFPGTAEGKSLGGFPKYWKKVLKGTTLEGITPHVLRHSFASIANDLGFTEATVAALLGHSRSTVTSRYIHTIDTALIMAADTIAGYIDGLLDGVQFKRTSYALDRTARQAALSRLFSEVVTNETADVEARAA
ncbi:tyrosine-type recombinase/integrase [Aminobacter sp. P9b]|uniref:Integrase n=1 Tax=Aminobacter ciceronei TaxID=150723 RepID=A0ABR6CHR8_9HYPH|nr:MULTISPECIES: site-specific integrase [Aminobacter]MBA8910135.1 integrase [Aminobacter ciceronei]MBA9023907.1 integrase [Aminobacter ciceronei]MRX34642.1 tyrosine-type recombinase/integrase [Aminobacter sp. MDW-2]QNH34767.1 tyrosine-type recombinase/integrase [Aminobacter sp. MDW-2]